VTGSPVVREIAPTFGEVAREATLRDYLDVLRRRRWSIIAAFLLTLCFAVGFSLSMHPVYRATTTVTTDKTPPMLLLNKTGDFSLFADQAAAQAPNVFTLVELIRSQSVKDGAIARLTPAIGKDAAEDALKRPKTQQVRNTEIVRINVDDSDPKVAADAANALAASLIETNLRARRQRATETREFIARQLADSANRLRSSEEDLVAFKRRHGDVSLPEETTLSLQKLADLQAQRVDLDLQRREVEARIVKGRADLAKQAKISPTNWTPSPLIGSLQAQLANLEIELSGLRRQLTPKAQAVISTQAKITETKRRLDAEQARNLQAQTYSVDPIYQTLIQQVAQAEMARPVLSSRESALNAAIAAYSQKVQGVPPREIQLTRLSRSVKEAEDIYLLLSEKSQDARIAEASIGSAIRVVDRAQVPKFPIKPRRQLNTLLGAVLGLIVGVGVGFLREEFDDTIKSSEDVERLLGAPVLGAIPLLPDNKKGGDGSKPTRLPALVDAGRRSPGAEAYRALRTHVLFSMPDVERKCLLVTSALPEEGKSTVAANLALAIARTDRRVWLVDGDLRRPALGMVFREANSPGLASLLAGQAELDDVVHPATGGISFVASGPTVPNPAELLGSQRMARLIAKGRNQADVVIIDSPPLLPVTDAEVVGAQVDGVLLVVKIGATERHALAQARRRLEQVRVRVVGAVLNFVPAGSRDGYYGGYYYAQYASQDERDVKAGHPSSGKIRLKQKEEER